MLIRLLGPVAINTGDGWGAAGRPQQSCVLASLALSVSKAVTNEALASHVWGHSAPKSARNAIHGHITRIRALFAAHPEVSLARASSYGYRLEMNPQDIDVFQMRTHSMGALSAAEEGHHDRALRLWRTAEQLWREPALTGLESAWAQHIRRKLDGERLKVLKGRFDAQLALGRHEDIVDELTGLVFEHPLAEPFIAQLMTAQVRSGHSNEALMTFAQAQHHFREQLGTDPGDTLSELHQHILRQGGTPPAATAPGTPAVTQLPDAPADFTGRHTQIAALTRNLPSDTVVNLVSGIPGTGKTSLALRVAHQLRDSFPDGQIFVDLHGYSVDEAPLTISQALDRLLAGLGVPHSEIPGDTAERARLYRETVAGKRILIVLDNAIDEPRVEPLLPGEGTCRVLVTSRSRLSTMTNVNRMTLPPMTASEGVQLFLAIYGHQTSDINAVYSIVELCGGLPLAIFIAASRLRARPHWNPAMLRDRLCTARDRLGVLNLGQRGLEAQFTMSYQRLPGQLRKLFRSLGALPSPQFHPETAAAITGESIDEVEWPLEDLVDENLLQRNESHNFVLHDLLWLFAGNKLKEEASEGEHRAITQQVASRSGIEPVATWPLPHEMWRLADYLPATDFATTELYGIQR